MKRPKLAFPVNFYYESLELAIEDVRKECGENYEEDHKFMSWDYFCEVFDRIIDCCLKNIRSSNPTRDAKIIYCRYARNMSYKEISSELGVTNSVIGSTIRKMKIACSKIIQYNTMSEYEITEYCNLSRLNLSNDCIHPLYASGIYTIKDLISYSESDLLKIRNIGPVVLGKIEKALEDNGFRLKSELINRLP